MHKHVVVAITQLTPRVILLTLQPKHPWDRLRFSAGQYAALGFMHHGRPSPMRCFSIVNAPNKAGELQFAMRIIGEFTQALASLQPGDDVLVRGPFGNFVVDEAYDRNVVLLAGGIGITPCMSVVRAHVAQQSAMPMMLLYSCSSQNDILFYDELRQLEARSPNLQVMFFVTNGPVDKLGDARVLRSRITEQHLVDITHGHYNVYTFFICGPKQFIGSLRGTLLAKGAHPENIVTEEFTPSKATQVLAAQPGWQVQRWVYGLTGALLLAATAGVAALDLVRVVPRVTSQASVTTAPASTTTPATIPAPATTTVNTINTTTANNSSSGTPAMDMQPVYRSPVTSVS